jgi:hypothetical protein
MDSKLEISEQYLDETLKSASIKLVGEVMSSWESITNSDELKIVVKNTVYQNFRDLKAQIKAFNSGVKFVTTPRLTK